MNTNRTKLMQWYIYIILFNYLIIIIIYIILLYYYLAAAAYYYYYYCVRERRINLTKRGCRWTRRGGVIATGRQAVWPRGYANSSIGRPIALGGGLDGRDQRVAPVGPPAPRNHGTVDGRGLRGRNAAAATRPPDDGRGDDERVRVDAFRRLWQRLRLLEIVTRRRVVRRRRRFSGNTRGRPQNRWAHARPRPIINARKNHFIIIQYIIILSL